MKRLRRCLNKLAIFVNAESKGKLQDNSKLQYSRYRVQFFPWKY